MNVENPTLDKEASYRVYRGGKWFSGAMLVRASQRSNRDPSNRDGSLSFRLVRNK